MNRPHNCIPIVNTWYNIISNYDSIHEDVLGQWILLHNGQSIYPEVSMRKLQDMSLEEISEYMKLLAMATKCYVPEDAHFTLIIFNAHNTFLVPQEI